MKCECPKCGFKYEVIAKQRSIPQNNRYWGMIIPALCDHFGYFPLEMHEELKAIFNAKDSKLEPGKRYGGTTTSMTTKEFVSYCESIELWAYINFGIEFPEIKDEKEKPVSET